MLLAQLNVAARLPAWTRQGVPLVTSESTNELSVSRVSRVATHSLASTSASVSAPILQLTRPPLLTAKPAASGRLNPAKLAAFSRALKMPLRMVQSLLEKNPALLSVEADQLQAVMQELSAGLALTPKEVVYMMSKQPTFLVQTPVDTVKRRLQTLAASLQLPVPEVTAWAAVQPSVLMRDPAVLQRRVQAFAKLYGVNSRAMVRMIMSAPQYLTDSEGSVQQRLEAMALSMRKPARLVHRMVMLQPDLVFLSPRILTNKLKVLQSILDKDWRHIMTIAMKCPKLLRTNLDHIRSVYEALPRLVGNTVGFTYAMVCHNPALLLHRMESLDLRYRRLRCAMLAVPAWHQEYTRMSPAQLADCLGCNGARYLRLDYLVKTGQAAGVAMMDALSCDRSKFVQRFPQFLPVVCSYVQHQQAQQQRRRVQLSHQGQRSHTLRLAPLHTQSATAAATAHTALPLSHDMQHASTSHHAALMRPHHANSHAGSPQHATSGATSTGTALSASLQQPLAATRAPSTGPSAASSSQQQQQQPQQQPQQLQRHRRRQKRHKHQQEQQQGSSQSLTGTLQAQQLESLSSVHSLDTAGRQASSNGRPPGASSSLASSGSASSSNSSSNGNGNGNHSLPSHEVSCNGADIGTAMDSSTASTSGVAAGVSAASAGGVSSASGLHFAGADDISSSTSSSSADEDGHVLVRLGSHSQASSRHGSNGQSRLHSLTNHHLHSLASDDLVQVQVEEGGPGQPQPSNGHSLHSWQAVHHMAPSQQYANEELLVHSNGSLGVEVAVAMISGVGGSRSSNEAGPSISAHTGLDLDVLRLEESQDGHWQQQQQQQQHHQMVHTNSGSSSSSSSRRVTVHAASQQPHMQGDAPGYPMPSFAAAGAAAGVPR